MWEMNHFSLWIYWLCVCSSPEYSFLFSLFFFFYRHFSCVAPPTFSVDSNKTTRLVSTILSRVLRDSTTHSVRLSVGWSVGRLVSRSRFTFFYDYISLTSLHLPKWSSDLKCGPCPPARDFGSRLSGLVEQRLTRWKVMS